MVGPYREDPVAPALRPQEKVNGYRVTALQLFEQCPERWAWQYLTPRQRIGSDMDEAVRLGTVKAEDADKLPPRTDSKWSLIGNAAHLAIEEWLQGQVTGPADVKRCQERMLAAGAPETEARNLTRYIDRLGALCTDRGAVLLGCELEFEVEVVPGWPLLMGHIDLALGLQDGSVLIVDHKTNRHPTPVSDWVDKMQPRAYAWEAGRRWGRRRRIKYMIGYVNAARDIEWDAPDPSGVEFARRYVGVCTRIKAQREARAFEASVGAHCFRCPVMKVCPAQAAEVKRVLGALVSPAKTP